MSLHAQVLVPLAVYKNQEQLSFILNHLVSNRTLHHSNQGPRGVEPKLSHDMTLLLGHHSR